MAALRRSFVRDFVRFVRLRRVRVGSHPVHAVYPQFVHEDEEGGGERDCEKNADQSVQSSHYEYGEDDDRGMEGDGAAHYYRLEEV